ncbi:MAG TPA: adenylate/guanylate cyclase domain-containing protein [Gaiellaceae bacterium]|nr:adenylate/guanylate cyclase domain-containing protein [Gaiellaceae bacterium]
MTIGAHRKVVTVLFCDVVGSTALGESVDPEALQGLLAGYFERMKAIVEAHGGTVEKFIGDAVMAVFGVPVAHEDDALRACRAAMEMRAALPELGVEGRIGVNTGEVLAGTEERLATGDTVNVAARLEQAAKPGEVLIGAETLALAAASVDVGEERSLELKGKSEPVVAHPLGRVRDAGERSHASRFVGRERELQQLVDSWDRALAGRRCELVTVVGDPGVGKSRLVAETLAQIDARVVRGRCLSYGEGITYWPVVEVVKQLDAVPTDEAAARAISSLLGETERVSGTDEIAWAFRKLLEEQAPLVVCFDDIQWAEETFLGLVESTALLSTGAPVLLLCMARPELLDRRPGWLGTLRLEPLPEEEAAVLVGEALPGPVRERIVRASGGNPLFLTEMLALADEGADVEVPATLRALLAARLDQLDEPERRVLERGAVEGELFHRGTVQALAPEEIEVTPRLAALVRRDLIRPDRPVLPQEDAYRFRHLLIRDAAYDALPKVTRADLHRRFAEWLEEHGQDLVELDEILGYHLEQAARYLDDLGRPDPQITLAAGDRLAAAGRRALWRGDEHAAVSLLGQSLELTRPLRLDVNLELDLAACHVGDPREAAAIARQAAERATRAGDSAGEAVARAVAAHYRTMLGQASPDEIEALALAALPQLEEAGDHAGLAHAWGVLGFGVANPRGRFDDWVRANEESFRHARLAGRQASGSIEVPLIYGSRPASEALETLERQENRLSPWPRLCRAWLLAMLERFDESRPLAEESYARFREQSQNWIGDWVMAEIASLSGDHETARRYLKAVCDWLETTEQPAFLSSYAPRLGIELCALGRYREAEEIARRVLELDFEPDPWQQTLWRELQVAVHVSRGESAQAEGLAREAVKIAERTDSLEIQGGTLRALAEALEAAGRPEEAVGALREALDRYERKENLPLARRVRERLAELQPA